MKMKNRIAVLTWMILSLLVLPVHSQVTVGADRLFTDYSSLIEGKRVGLVTNHSAVLADGRHLADALIAWKKTSLVVLFGPEHGIRGDAPDGRTVQNGLDERTGLPVYSLYGKINKPTDEMLKDVDVLVFDIQDVGARFYTFVSTMFLSMESAAEHHIPIIILDRPNPIRGIQVEGPIRVDSMKSFVGWGPMPVSHGMTFGELARMANEEGWLAKNVRAELTVVPMIGWTRTMWFDETGRKWIKPSPNMSSLATAILYPGTCLIEGTSLSEGRGTEHPFEWIGAPYMDGIRWAEVLNAQGIPGVSFSPITFVPQEIPNVASNPKHRGKLCSGISIKITDRNAIEPFRLGLFILSTAKSVAPDSMKWRAGSIDRLSGTTELRRGLDAGKSPDELLRGWEPERSAFSKVRAKYLMY
jgi:uncharacterized protein YbbC (DUF1343 family)